MEQKDVPTLRIEPVPLDEALTVRMEERPMPVKAASERPLQVLIVVVSVLLLGYIIYSLSPEFTDFYQYGVRPAAGRYWPNLIAVALMLAVSFNLYVFRGYLTFWFGLAEIALACGLGWYAINKAAAGAVPDSIVILFAALYLMGRGWVNTSSETRTLKIDRQKKQ